jgi:hypothetical protein
MGECRVFYDTPEEKNGNPLDGALSPEPGAHTLIVLKKRDRVEQKCCRFLSLPHPHGDHRFPKPHSLNQYPLVGTHHVRCLVQSLREKPREVEVDSLPHKVPFNDLSLKTFEEDPVFLGSDALHRFEGNPLGKGEEKVQRGAVGGVLDKVKEKPQVLDVVVLSGEKGTYGLFPVEEGRVVGMEKVGEDVPDEVGGDVLQAKELHESRVIDKDGPGKAAQEKETKGRYGKGTESQGKHHGDPSSPKEGNECQEPEVSSDEYPPFPEIPPFQEILAEPVPCLERLRRPVLGNLRKTLFGEHPGVPEGEEENLALPVKLFHLPAEFKGDTLFPLSVCHKEVTPHRHSCQL